MVIKGNLKNIFASKLNSLGFLRKYNFNNMECSISTVKDIDNLFKFLIFKELENDEINTVREIIKYYINTLYAEDRSMSACSKVFINFLNYIPNDNIFKEVLKDEDIYNYIANHKFKFYHLKNKSLFHDALLTNFEILEFHTLKNIPQEIYYYYENVDNTKLLTFAKLKEIIKLYKETNNIVYRNILIEHYQRLIFKYALKSFKLYNIDLEILIDTYNKVLFDSINAYNLNNNITLNSYIRNRLSHYTEILSKRKNNPHNYLVNHSLKEKDEIEDMLNKLDNILTPNTLNNLILNIEFSDKEIYFLLYYYGLFNFPKKTYDEIAKTLGVSKSYINTDIKNRTIKKIKRAILLKTIDFDHQKLTKEEQKIIRICKPSYETMQSNSIKRFFNEEDLINITQELTKLIQEDQYAKYILRKRYNRMDDLYNDNYLLAHTIVSYVDKFNPLKVEEYYYLYEIIIPKIKENLKTQNQALDLVKKQC